MKKLECVGHVQKHLGTRCRKVIALFHGQKLNDGKGISDAGRLTEKAINKLQNYFGIAIRQNVNNLYQMKKCVWAVLFHNSNISDENVRHQFCPRTRDSWCLFQSDKIFGGKKYKPKLSLPLSIKNVLLPLFCDLSFR